MVRPSGYCSIAHRNPFKGFLSIIHRLARRTVIGPHRELERAKFEGNPRLEAKLAARRQQLLETGDAWDLEGGRGPRVTRR